MATKKKKKAPSITGLKKEIRELKAQLKEFENCQGGNFDKKDLTNKGFGVIKEKETGRYQLVELFFDDNLTTCVFGKVEYLGKACHPYQAEYELKKLIAHERLLPQDGNSSVKDNEE